MDYTSSSNFSKLGNIGNNTIQISNLVNKHFCLGNFRTLSFVLNAKIILKTPRLSLVAPTTSMSVGIVSSFLFKTELPRPAKRSSKGALPVYTPSHQYQCTTNPFTFPLKLYGELFLKSNRRNLS